ncbi:MAG: hypothetical protein Q8O74_05985, partial [bacterium]|nr:hypothetical protein [bacterium]
MPKVKKSVKKKTVKKAGKKKVLKKMKSAVKKKLKRPAKPVKTKKVVVRKLVKQKVKGKVARPNVKRVEKAKKAAPSEPLILVLNPGSTSTKVAVYKGAKPLVSESIDHNKAQIEKYARIVDQYPMRKAVVLDFLVRNKIDPKTLAAVVDRGGLLKPISSGTYIINQAMLDDLNEARRGEHISNVGAFIAREIADQSGSRAFIVDAVSVDEFSPLARISGLAGI